MIKNEHEIVDLITKIIKLLVESPDEITVEVVITPVATVLHYFVSPDDVLRLTGRQNQTVKCLQSLLFSISGSTGKKFSLEILTRSNSVGR
jgi:predicted RNA-binding protein YlqC (UPF0109 family)